MIGAMRLCRRDSGLGQKRGARKCGSILDFLGLAAGSRVARGERGGKLIKSLVAASGGTEGGGNDGFVWSVAPWSVLNWGGESTPSF